MDQAEKRLRERAIAIATEDQDQSELITFTVINFSSHLEATAEFASGRVVTVRDSGR